MKRRVLFLVLAENAGIQPLLSQVQGGGGLCWFTEPDHVIVKFCYLSEQSSGLFWQRLSQLCKRERMFKGQH